MGTYQTESNCIHFTNEILKCSCCWKKKEFVYDVKWISIFCMDCFARDLGHIMWGNEFIEIRGLQNPPNSRRKQKIERNKMGYALRYEILKRDSFKCILCWSNDRLEIDHKSPISKWWSTRKDNLQTLCFACNRGKTNS